MLKSFQNKVVYSILLTMDMWMWMMRTCFTVGKGSTKESGGIAAKSKKVEDHRCHGACLLLVVRIVRLQKRYFKIDWEPRIDNVYICFRRRFFGQCKSSD